MHSNTSLSHAPLRHFSVLHVFFFLLCLCLLLALFSLCAMSSPEAQKKLDFRDYTTLRIVHEASLEDLLRARNYAALHLLNERNALLHEQYFVLVLSSWQICDLLSLSVNGGRNSVQPRLYTMTTSSSCHPTLTCFFLMLSFPPPLALLCHSMLLSPLGRIIPWM